MKKPKLHIVLSSDKRGHAMTLRRKAGRGIGNFKDVTKPMLAIELQFIRARAKRTRREAQYREWILLLTPAGISKRVV